MKKNTRGIEAYLSSTDVQKMLSISKGFLYTLIREHGFPSFKLGSKRLFKESDILNYIKERRHGST